MGLVLESVLHASRLTCLGYQGRVGQGKEHYSRPILPWYSKQEEAFCRLRNVEMLPWTCNASIFITEELWNANCQGKGRRITPPASRSFHVCRTC